MSQRAGEAELVPSFLSSGAASSGRPPLRVTAAPRPGLDTPPYGLKRCTRSELPAGHIEKHPRYFPSKVPWSRLCSINYFYYAVLQASSDCKPLTCT